MSQTENKSAPLKPGGIYWLLVLAVFSMWPVFVAALSWTDLNDDSYISLTYSKNLAAGNGFVYNAPPQTLGTTTPLFTLCAALLGILLPFVELSRLAVYFSAACWIGVAWIVYAFRREFRLLPWQAVFIGCVILLTGWRVLGSETYLFQFLLFLSFAFYWRTWHLASGLAIGLLFLTRGEGCLLLPLLLAVTLYRLRTDGQEGRHKIFRDAALLSVGAAVPVLLWTAYAIPTFGSVLPSTLAAKQIQADLGMVESFGPNLLRWAKQWWYRPQIPWFGMVYWAFAITGLGVVLLRHKRWAVFLAWTALYITGYTLLNVASYFWYGYPIYMVWVGMVAFGLMTMLEYAWQREGRYARAVRICAVLVALVVLVPQVHVRSTLQYTSDYRAPLYRALCDWLDENTEPEESVAFAEVGYLGYFSQNRVVDLLGLTTPDILPHLANGDYLAGFWQYRPEYYVHRSWDYKWFDPLIESDEFNRQYSHAATIRHPDHGGELNVYVRNEAQTQ